MEEGKPSFTTEIDAVIRAIETRKPESQRLCYDPFARGFAGTTNRIIGKIPPLRKLALLKRRRGRSCRTCLESNKVKRFYFLT